MKRTMNTRVHLVHIIGMAFMWLKSSLWPRINKYSICNKIASLTFCIPCVVTDLGFPVLQSPSLACKGDLY